MAAGHDDASKQRFKQVLVKADPVTGMLQGLEHRLDNDTVPDMEYRESASPTLADAALQPARDR